MPSHHRRARRSESASSSSSVEIVDSYRRRSRERSTERSKHDKRYERDTGRRTSPYRERDRDLERRHERSSRRDKDATSRYADAAVYLSALNRPTLTLGGGIARPAPPPLPAKSLDVAALDDEKEMQRLMGFTQFNTTKGKKVPNNDVGEVHHAVKRKYRQYMNRKGGFNRPLDFVA